MTDKDEQGRYAPPQPQGAPADAARQRRLAAALRENLKRRKAQARGRSAKDPVPSASDD